VLLDALLRPFMFTMRALVIIQKFFNVDNYWTSSTHIYYTVAAPRLDTRWFSAFLSFQMYRFLAFKFDMKSVPTTWTESEELHFRSIFDRRTITNLVFEADRRR